MIKYKTKSIFTTLLIFVGLLFSGCSNGPDTLDEDIKFLLDVLYTHTGQMKDYYTNEELTQIKDFNINEYEFDQTKLTSDMKIKILEKVYNLETYGNYKNKITQLENKMVEVMYAGVELES
jgi:hypothetical protein